MVFLLWSQLMLHCFSKTVTYGYAPITFPRDPVLFNQYAEHILIGQILMPLIETDREGNLVAGIAKSWELSEDGKKITFTLKNKEFSNGKKITSEDVKYTLKRNIALKSQSSEYLRNIIDIKALDGILIITLRQKDMTLLKALTRDQLGIVPSGWKFDEKSDQPFIGSGDYNLIRKDLKWFLIRNDKSNEKKLDFELLFYKNEEYHIEKQLPTIAPYTNSTELKSLKALNGSDTYLLTDTPSFTQNLFWVTKNSSLYRNPSDRYRVTTALNEALIEYLKNNDLLEATGIIPIGIPGSLTAKIQSSKPKNYVHSAKEIIYNFFYLAGSHEKFINSQALKNSSEKHKIKINFTPYSISEDLKNKIGSADIIATTFAGGFNDPMGFIGILNKTFSIPFEDYLPDDIKVYYIDAQYEQNWVKRTKLFELLNSKIMMNNFCVAGWRPRKYAFTSPEVKIDPVLYRYTPRLINYSVNNPK